MFGGGAGERPARSRRNVAASQRRRLRTGPSGHGLAARRPATGRAGRPAGQRVRVRGQTVLQQNAVQTLPGYRRGQVHASRRHCARARALGIVRRRRRRHVRYRLDPGACSTAAASQLHRFHGKTDRIPHVAAVRPGQASQSVLQTRRRLATVRLEVHLHAASCTSSGFPVRKPVTTSSKSLYIVYTHRRRNYIRARGIRVRFTLSVISLIFSPPTL